MTDDVVLGVNSRDTFLTKRQRSDVHFSNVKDGYLVDASSNRLTDASGDLLYTVFSVGSITYGAYDRDVLFIRNQREKIISTNTIYGDYIIDNSLNRVVDASGNLLAGVEFVLAPTLTVSGRDTLFIKRDKD